MSGVDRRCSRRTLLRATSATAIVAGTAAAAARPSTASAATATAGRDSDPLFRQLDAKIEAGLVRYAIPGAAVGVWYRGKEYVKGYGVTNVDNPVPIDGDTVFRIASTTKTFTGTTAMRLVERGRIALDAPVIRYLPDFTTLDPAAAGRVTVRHLLNHTGGWMGDCFLDTGQGEDALAAFVAGIAHLPQQTEPGTVFAYNNSALDVVGRIIEVVVGALYETVVRNLVLDPLGLDHSRYLEVDTAGFTVATSHDIVDGKPVPTTAFFEYPRGQNPGGGLISSARDQLRWARFHLGDGTVPGGGQRLLGATTLRSMRSRPGPGGTLGAEIDGVGVTWILRHSAEGVRIVEHGGDVRGQHSGFVMVPDRDFAITVLTNSNGGPGLVNELCGDDWALRNFAGLSSPKAKPYQLSAKELASYEGDYTSLRVASDGTMQVVRLLLTASDGQLVAKTEEEVLARLAFYRSDHALVLGPDGEHTGDTRLDFIRSADGQVEWLRANGRLLRHETVPATTVLADEDVRLPGLPWPSPLMTTR